MNIELLKKATVLSLRKAENGYILDYQAEVRDVFHSGQLVFSNDTSLDLLDLLEDWVDPEKN